MSEMTLTQQLVTIGCAVAATLLTRYLPYLLFPAGKKTPDFVVYLGKYLAPAVFGLLIVYCLRNVSFSEGGTYGIAESAAIAIVAGSFLWKKNMMISMAAGTIAYMILVQTFFA
jgi:branched-subunit amino acid transport protein AzlD